MAIVPIPNQPINLQPPNVDPCNIGDNKEYCTLYQTDGVGYVQFRQTPCDGNIISEGNFATVDDWTADAGWVHVPNSMGASLADGSYRHTPGTSDDLEQTITAINGKYCSVRFTISGRTAGQVSVSIGGTNLGAIDSNGTFTLYDVAGVTGVLRFRANSDFDGTLSYVSAYLLVNTFTATLIDIETGLAASSQPTFTFNYNKDFVSAQWSWSGYEGCYKVSIGDPCNPGTSSEILLNPSFSTNNDWTIVQNGGGPTQCMVISDDNLNVTLVPSGFGTEIIIENCYQDIQFTSGNCYYRFEISLGHVDNYFTNPAAFELCFGLYDINGSIITSCPIPMEYNTYYFDWYGNLTNYDTPRFLISVVSDGGGTGGEYFEIASASLKKVYDCADNGGDYVSNCLAVATDHDCAKRVIGDCYPGTGDGVVKYGFMFDGNFRLDQQVRFLKFNPTYPADADDYKYSSGERSITYASREKFYEGLCDYADENFHDAFSTQVLCDTLTIDTVEYFVKPGDYKPEWDKDGRQRLAQARIQLSKKTSIISSN